MVENTKYKYCSQKWKSPEHLNMLIHKGNDYMYKKRKLN